MGYGLGQTLPPKFSDFLIAKVAADVAQNTEFCIWQGDTAAGSNNSFDGFEKLIAAAATAGDIPAAQQVAAVAGGLTSANIIDELSKVVDAIPAALYGKEDLLAARGEARPRRHQLQRWAQRAQAVRESNVGGNETGAQPH